MQKHLFNWPLRSIFPSLKPPTTCTIGPHLASTSITKNPNSTRRVHSLNGFWMSALHNSSLLCIPFHPASFVLISELNTLIIKVEKTLNSYIKPIGEQGVHGVSENCPRIVSVQCSFCLGWLVGGKFHFHPPIGALVFCCPYYWNCNLPMNLYVHLLVCSVGLSVCHNVLKC